MSGEIYHIEEILAVSCAFLLVGFLVGFIAASVQFNQNHNDQASNTNHSIQYRSTGTLNFCISHGYDQIQNEDYYSVDNFFARCINDKTGESRKVCGFPKTYWCDEK